MKYALIVMYVMLLFCLGGRAVAGDVPKPAILGTFGSWTAYRHFEKPDMPVCYLAGPPVKSEGDYKKRDAVFLLITHRPSQNSYNVVSYVAGYKLKSDRPIGVRIDRHDFVMIPDGDTGWTADQASDEALTRALKAGHKMMVTGVSRKGTLTKDYFDLRGSSKALRAIDRACKI